MTHLSAVVSGSESEQFPFSWSFFVCAKFAFFIKFLQLSAMTEDYAPKDKIEFQMGWLSQDCVRWRKVQFTEYTQPFQLHHQECLLVLMGAKLSD